MQLLAPRFPLALGGKQNKKGRVLSVLPRLSCHRQRARVALGQSLQSPAGGNPVRKKFWRWKELAVVSEMGEGEGKELVHDPG